MSGRVACSIVVASIGVALLASCGDDATAGDGATADTSVTFPDTVVVPDGSTDTTTAAGDLEVSGSLPTGFPEDFPLPEGAKIEFGSSTVVDNDDVRSVDLSVPGDAASVAEFYRDAIDDAGFAVLYDEIGNLRFETDSFVGDVLLSARDEDTVSVVLTATSPKA